jgi:enamine deaminase RidA (YjgF/YER057c/UK114 family)
LSGPVDPVNGGRNLGPIGEQIRQTLRNMAHMPEWAGSSLDRIVKVTIVLADARDYDDMNRVWREFSPAELSARPQQLRAAAQQRQWRGDRVRRAGRRRSCGRR